MKAAITETLVKKLRPKEKPFEVRDEKVKGFILRVQPTGQKTYIVQYARGKRITLGNAAILTPAQARDRAKETLADVLKGADPQETKRKAKAHTLESYILNVYAPYVETHHRRGRATIAMIKANFFPTLGKCKLNEITAWSVDKWRNERLKEHRKDGTRRPASSINRYLNALKAALSRAVEWDIIKENPLNRMKPTKTDNKAEPRYLSNDEESRLRAALDAREAQLRLERTSANAWRAERGYKPLPALSDGFADHLKPMVILSLNTGLRRGELFNLKWADIDLERATLTVRGEGAKSGQTRHVPLNDEALAVLTSWEAQGKAGDLVFPARKGERFDNVNTAWSGLLRAAAITKFRWHDLRHTFASRLVMAKVDLNTVRELLGHADIKMTLRYAHLAPKVKAEAVQKLVRPEIGKEASSQIKALAPVS